jgi:hypothetical protein
MLKRYSKKKQSQYFQMVKSENHSLSTLIHELDLWISRYVRLNAADEYGQCTCVCCSLKMHWSLMDTAHYIRRDNMGTRFYLPNLAPAAKSCNQYDPEWHLVRWRAKLTPEQREDLELRRQSFTKWTRPEIEELIIHYKDEVKKLRKFKNL